MKNMKLKLLVSVMALACAAVLATTTTFAWISLSSTASVTDLNLQVMSEGDLRINTRNNNNWVDYASWGYTISMASWNFALSPTTINNTVANDEYVTTGGNLSYKLHNNLNATTSQYLKQEFYFASLEEYEVEMRQLLTLGNRTGKGSSSATKYHYIISEVGTGDTAHDELFRVEFYYIPPTHDGAGASTDDDMLYYRAISEMNYGVVDPVAADYDVGGPGDDPITTPGAFEETTDYDPADGTFTILVNGETIAGTLTRPAIMNADDPDPSQWAYYELAPGDVELTLATGQGYNPGEELEADADKALRIALVHHTINSGDIVMVYDPHSGEGWSQYTTFNMAHETYSAEWNRNVILTEGATPMAKTDYPTFVLEDTGATTAGGIAIYGASVTLYIWLEGTDADCMNAIAGYIVSGRLEFTGDALSNDTDTAVGTFLSEHAVILAKTVADVAVGDKPLVLAALADYKQLTGAGKGLVAAEKALLDDLLAKIIELEP